MDPFSFRIGIGCDLHILEENLPFVLGGVKINFPKGTKAHSDGDCLLHALCDALLGAAGLPDIGCLFPDTDSKYKNMCSENFVIEVLQKVKAEGFRVINVDTIICLEKPKIAPYRDLIRQNLSRLLNLPVDCVGLKAKTNEGQDAVGRNDAVATQVVCLLAKNSSVSR